MSHKELARLCTNLQTAGVEVRPDEITSPTKQVIFRVLVDFATVAYNICPDAMQQPLACNLENLNPHSAVAPSTANRLIMCRAVLNLLSKGSMQFSLTDVFKADQKKFSQMTQQMLKYLYHSEGIYELVNETCNSIDEQAARVACERQELDFERNELQVASDRLQVLTDARVPETLAEAVQKKQAIDEDCEKASANYNDLKQRVERASADLQDSRSALEHRERQLAELREMIVDDPDAAVEKLRSLQEEVVRHREQLAGSLRSLRDTSDIIKALNDALDRLKAAQKVASQASGANDELMQMEKTAASRINDQKRSLSDLESEIQELKATVETKKRQLEKIQREHQETTDALTALDKDEAEQEELRAKKSALKRPLVKDIAKTTTLIKTLQQTLVSEKQAALRKIAEGHSAEMRRWNDHLKDVAVFTAKCQQADERLAERQAKLAALAEAINQLPLD